MNLLVELSAYRFSADEAPVMTRVQPCASSARSHSAVGASLGQQMRFARLALSAGDLAIFFSGVRRDLYLLFSDDLSEMNQNYVLRSLSEARSHSNFIIN